MTSRMRLKRKEVDDVLGGDEMWAHADRTQGIKYLPLLLLVAEETDKPLFPQPPATNVISTVPFSINCKYAPPTSL